MPQFSKADLNKFWHGVQNEVALICAKFGKDLFRISNVIGRKTKWPTLYSNIMMAKLVFSDLQTESLSFYLPITSFHRLSTLRLLHDVAYLSCTLCPRKKL